MTAEFDRMQLPTLGAIKTQPRSAVPDYHPILGGIHETADRALFSILDGVSILADNDRAP
jgi:hypothetical protein